MATDQEKAAQPSGCDMEMVGCPLIGFGFLLVFELIHAMTGTVGPTPAEPPPVCDERLFSTELCSDDLSQDDINALQAALNEDETDTDSQAQSRR